MGLKPPPAFCELKQSKRTRSRFREPPSPTKFAQRSVNVSPPSSSPKKGPSASLPSPSSGHAPIQISFLPRPSKPILKCRGGPSSSEANKSVKFRNVTSHIEFANFNCHQNVNTFIMNVQNAVRLGANGVTVIEGSCWELVKMRVPTTWGTSVFRWEVYTSENMVGMGLFFEYGARETELTISREEIEDEEEEDDRERWGLPSRHRPFEKEVFPVMKRCHRKKVVCGSHAIPGTGTYTLKFAAPCDYRIYIRIFSS